MAEIQNVAHHAEFESVFRILILLHYNDQTSWRWIDINCYAVYALNKERKYLYPIPLTYFTITVRDKNNELFDFVFIIIIALNRSID